MQHSCVFSTDPQRVPMIRIANENQTTFSSASSSASAYILGQQNAYVRKVFAGARRTGRHPAEFLQLDVHSVNLKRSMRCLFRASAGVFRPAAGVTCSRTDTTAAAAAAAAAAVRRSNAGRQVATCTTGVDGVGGDAEEALVTCTTGLGVLRRTGFVRRNRFLVLVLRAPATGNGLGVWGSARQPTGISAFGLWSQATSTVSVLAQMPPIISRARHKETKKQTQFPF